MRVAVIGASGSMGVYFSIHFLGEGNTVVGSDKNKKGRRVTGVEYAPSNHAAANHADLVLVAVPMEETPKVVQELAGEVGPGCKVVEISSIKGKRFAGARHLLAKRGASLLSLHPLFGPSSRDKGPKICVVGGKSDLTSAKELFPRARLILMTAEEHDRLMANVLSLVHLMNLAFISTVAKQVGLKKLRRVLTPLASAQLTVAEATLSQDADLYTSIQTSNPFVNDVLDSFAGELNSIRKLISDGYPNRFKRNYMSIAGEFSPGEKLRALRRVYEGFGS